jgi:hypothetical protein
VSHPFPADFGLNDLYTALFTNHSAVFHALITTAKTFIILNRAKDLCTEKSISFRFKCPVVDGFFTSPCDQERIFSGEAMEIFIALNLIGFFGFSK